MNETFAYLILGIAAGALLLWVIQTLRLRSTRQLADSIIAQAEIHAAKLEQKKNLELKEREIEEERRQQEKWQKEQSKLQRYEEKIARREELIEEKLSLIEKRLSRLDAQEKERQSAAASLEEGKRSLEREGALFRDKLEKLASLTGAEAKKLLRDEVELQVKNEAAALIQRSMKEAQEASEEQGRRIIATAIQRLAVPTASQTTVRTIPLPNDETKGRLIGREGRNIRAFEQAAGVTLVIDDTPRAALLSGFDPVRLHVAHRALQELITDGRIHPSRIEEAVAEAEKQVEVEVNSYGRDAAIRIGAIDLAPQLITLLGKLKLRTSFGHNLLDHSLEVAHLLGIMAAELGLNNRLAKRIGLLHDIGKAVSHEVEGSHALIGYQMALRYGESEEVANGIGCHHKEMEPITIEGSLCGAADALSASRPGARSGAIDEYIRRQSDLEAIAYGFPGVEKAFALQAGREVRVFVFPEMVDDNGLVVLARDLTRRIEKEMKLPGQVKISVTREKKVIQYL